MLRRSEARAWAERNPGRHVLTSRENLARLVDNLVGLPAEEARRLARRAIAAVHRALEAGEEFDIVVDGGEEIGGYRRVVRLRDEE